VYICSTTTSLPRSYIHGTNTGLLQAPEKGASSNNEEGKQAGQGGQKPSQRHSNHHQNAARKTLGSRHRHLPQQARCRHGAWAPSLAPYDLFALCDGASQSGRDWGTPRGRAALAGR
jgi:hypothetical protein